MIQVGEYVRFENGAISKITGKFQEHYILDYESILFKGNPVKHSPNIIDLIEIGDYVNSCEVIDIAEAPERAVYLNNMIQKGALIPYTNEKIKTIVTKEQFKGVEYKVC